MQCVELPPRTKENVFDIPPFMPNMYVVKLNSGGLLLYAPVKVHKETPELIYSWLESLGPVQWLVAGSGAQIHLLPDAIKGSGILQWSAKSANF